MHRSQYHGTGFGEKKELYCKMDQQGDRRQGSNLSQSRVMTKEFGEFQTWKLISSSWISPWRLFVLLEARFSPLKDFSLPSGLWWQHFYSLKSADWRFLVPGSCWRHRLHFAHVQCCHSLSPGQTLSWHIFSLIFILTLVSMSKTKSGKRREGTKTSPSSPFNLHLTLLPTYLL